MFLGFPSIPVVPWSTFLAPKSPPSVISISAAIPRYASKAPRARIRHPNPMPQMFMTCATLQYWGVGRRQLGWIKLDQIQDFCKVSCEVKLSIFHKAVAWGTLLLSTADFFGSGDEDVVSVSNRLSNGCQSLGFHKG